MKMDSFKMGFYHLKMCEQYFADVVRQSPGTVAARISKKNIRMISFMIKDFKSEPLIPADAIKGFSDEMNGDIMFHSEISRKSLLLTEKQKEKVEKIIDCVIKGEDTTVVIDNPFKN